LDDFIQITICKNGINERHISNVCNFTKPTETKPSLLTFNEVLTLFHEFGHGLHGMLANTVPKFIWNFSILGFVELPSQVMENWCYEPEALALFATHYQTGEIIPMELVQKSRKVLTFRRNGNYASVELWLTRHGMAWTRPISYNGY
jgi:peptidyl-dipeptidase Dcp